MHVRVTPSRLYAYSNLQITTQSGRSWPPRLSRTSGSSASTRQCKEWTLRSRNTTWRTGRSAFWIRSFARRPKSSSGAQGRFTARPSTRSVCCGARTRKRHTMHYAQGIHRLMRAGRAPVRYGLGSAVLIYAKARVAVGVRYL